MLTTLVNNIEMIAALCAIFAGAWLINTVLGIYENMHNKSQVWDTSKFLDGVKKGAILFVACLLIAALISLIPFALEHFGIQSALIEDVSIAAMASAILSVDVKYLTDAIKKFYNIIGTPATVEKENEEEA